MIGTTKLTGNAFLVLKPVDLPKLPLVPGHLIVHCGSSLIPGRIDYPASQDHGIRGAPQAQQAHHQLITVGQDLIPCGVETGDADVPLG